MQTERALLHLLGKGESWATRTGLAARVPHRHLGHEGQLKAMDPMQLLADAMPN
jgi:hypothetical protein